MDSSVAHLVAKLVISLTDLSSHDIAVLAIDHGPPGPSRRRTDGSGRRCRRGRPARLAVSEIRFSLRRVPPKSHSRMCPEARGASVMFRSAWVVAGAVFV